MKRKLDDWLTTYLSYNENSEAPISYHVWSGLSCIAAAFQRKVHMKWYPQRIFPNQYIILVGPSGQSRKGDAIGVARSIIENLTLTLIGEDNTQEALIREMYLAEQFFLDPATGNNMPHSSVTCFAEELAVFTGQQNATYLAYLTNWYDSRDMWTRNTKHQGKDEIVGMCFNFLVSTAPDWLPGILTRESIGGGFTSRCIFVVEEGKRQTVTNPNRNKPPASVKEDLIHDLQIIQTIVGEYDFDEETLQAYEKWYLESDRRFAKEGCPLGPMFNGYWSRRPTHTKKVSMALSASHSDDRIIRIGDFSRALSLLDGVEVNMPKVFSGIGRSKYAEDLDVVHAFIMTKRRVSRAELMRTFYRNVDDVGMEAIIKILSQMKSIRVARDVEEGETWYESLD